MIAGLIKLTRPAYSLGFIWPYLLTVYYARNAKLQGASDWFSAMALALMLGGVYVINDVLDIAVDSRKAVRRPLVNGDVPKPLATLWGTLLMLSGVVLAFCLAARMFAVLLLGITLGLVVYNLTSRRLGWFKQIAVALLTSSIYPLAAAQADGFHGPRAATLPVFALWMFLSAWAYEIFSDVADRKPDRMTGLPLTSLQRHPRWWLRAGELLLTMACLTLILPAILGCGRFYATAAPLLVGLPLMSAIASWKPEAKMRAVYLVFVGVGIATTMDVLLYS